MTCGYAQALVKCSIIMGVAALLYRAVREATRMPTKKPPFDETKTTQAAVLFLKMNNGSMNYMKLVKLLYNADREALHRWGRQITYDAPYSLKHGLVLSTILNRAKDVDPAIETAWSEHIKTQGYESTIIKDPGDGELSDAEVELLQEMFEAYRGRDQYYMRDEHHDKAKFPEWEDPGESSIPTDLGAVLAAVGFDESEREQILASLEEDEALAKYRER